MSKHPLILIALAACAPTYTSSRTGSYSPIAKPASCEFIVATSLPSADYVEIAVVDVSPKARSKYTGEGLGMAKTLQDFKREAAPYVCEAGGDLLLAEMNGLGDYVRGVVFARKDAPTAVATKDPEPTVAEPIAADPCATGTADLPACQALCEKDQQTKACHRVGEWYELGAGVEKNVSMAIRFYQVACERGAKSDCVRVKMLREKTAAR
ncbi:MAG: sel1 repeat family protein [Deltaproteobacteria bacterium]|nr:sel1 repeat family protein [Deltaproteobacteria bacterium]